MLLITKIRLLVKPGELEHGTNKIICRERGREWGGSVTMS
jgi:hypothetical protein